MIDWFRNSSISTLFKSKSHLKSPNDRRPQQQQQKQAPRILNENDDRWRNACVRFLRLTSHFNARMRFEKYMGLTQSTWSVLVILSKICAVLLRDKQLTGRCSHVPSGKSFNNSCMHAFLLCRPLVRLSNIQYHVLLVAFSNWLHIVTLATSDTMICSYFKLYFFRMQRDLCRMYVTELYRSDIVLFVLCAPQYNTCCCVFVVLINLSDASSSARLKYLPFHNFRIWCAVFSSIFFEMRRAKTEDYHSKRFSIYINIIINSCWPFSGAFLTTRCGKESQQEHAFFYYSRLLNVNVSWSSLNSLKMTKLPLWSRSKSDPDGFRSAKLINWNFFSWTTFHLFFVQKKEYDGKVNIESVTLKCELIAFRSTLKKKFIDEWQRLRLTVRATH